MTVADDAFNAMMAYVNAPQRDRVAALKWLHKKILRIIKGNNGAQKEDDRKAVEDIVLTLRSNHLGGWSHHNSVGHLERRIREELERATGGGGGGAGGPGGPPGGGPPAPPAGGGGRGRGPPGAAGGLGLGTQGSGGYLPEYFQKLGIGQGLGNYAGGHQVVGGTVNGGVSSVSNHVGHNFYGAAADAARNVNAQGNRSNVPAPAPALNRQGSTNGSYRLGNGSYRLGNGSYRLGLGFGRGASATGGPTHHQGPTSHSTATGSATFAGMGFDSPAAVSGRMIDLTNSSPENNAASDSKAGDDETKQEAKKGEDSPDEDGELKLALARSLADEEAKKEEGRPDEDDFQRAIALSLAVEEAEDEAKIEEDGVEVEAGRAAAPRQAEGAARREAEGADRGNNDSSDEGSSNGSWKDYPEEEWVE